MWKKRFYFKVRLHFSEHPPSCTGERSNCTVVPGQLPFFPVVERDGDSLDAPALVDCVFTLPAAGSLATRFPSASFFLVSEAGTAGFAAATGDFEDTGWGACRTLAGLELFTAGSVVFEEADDFETVLVETGLAGALLATVDFACVEDVLPFAAAEDAAEEVPDAGSFAEDAFERVFPTEAAGGGSVDANIIWRPGFNASPCFKPFIRINVSELMPVALAIFWIVSPLFTV